MCVLSLYLLSAHIPEVVSHVSYTRDHGDLLQPSPQMRMKSYQVSYCSLPSLCQLRLNCQQRVSQLSSLKITQVLPTKVGFDHKLALKKRLRELLNLLNLISWRYINSIYSTVLLASVRCDCPTVTILQ